MRQIFLQINEEAGETFKNNKKKIKKGKNIPQKEKQQKKSSTNV